ncbi:MAG: hypothetical protein ACLFUL_07580 [Desulfobacteraceae bacterium]
MAKLTPAHRIPWKEKDVESGDPQDLAAYMKALVRALRTMYSNIARVVNQNSVEYVSQDSRPTPSEGQMMVWEDSDAGAGEPTHYIVYTSRDGGTITFPSDEMA